MSKRQAIFLVAKLAFAATVLTWLFHKIDLARVLSAVGHAERGKIVAGVLLCLSMIVIGAWRWHRWLTIFDIQIPFTAIMCIAQIGQFFMMFVPGPTGDVLGRMVYISRLAPRRAGEACATVLLDRCLGLASVLALAVACIPWQWHVLSGTTQTRSIALIIISAGIAVCIFGAFFFLAGHPTHRWFEHRLRSLPAHSLRDEVARIWGLLCRHKVAVAKISAAAIITQFVCCGLYYLAGRSVGINISLFLWLTFVPILMAADTLPLTIAGLGVREYLLVLFLGVTAHIENDRALAASLVAFSMILISCLLGGVLYIFYRPKRKVEEAEEPIESGPAADGSTE